MKQNALISQMLSELPDERRVFFSGIMDQLSDRYVFRWNTFNDEYALCGWLEEHLNYWDWNDSYDGKAANQVDLLMPIKPRFAAGTRHSQERIVETFNYNGIPVEVVEWDKTIWCGKIGYAENNNVWFRS